MKTLTRGGVCPAVAHVSNLGPPGLAPTCAVARRMRDQRCVATLAPHIKTGDERQRHGKRRNRPGLSNDERLAPLANATSRSRTMSRDGLAPMTWPSSRYLRSPWKAWALLQGHLARVRDRVAQKSSVAEARIMRGNPAAIDGVALTLSPAAQ